MGPAAAERSQMWRVYLSALEEERRKIEVFGKELPLCLELVVQTIESYRRYLGDGEEAERRGMGLELQLEEFIPINGASSTSDDDDPKEKIPMDSHEEVPSDWLKSARLWDDHQQQQQQYQHHRQRQQQQSERLKYTGKENNEVGNGGRGGGGGGDGGGGGKSQRKSRRCWLPELHRSFLRALEQLGGSEAATPKQIRELMNVEGLTNDEVKSHLQKYRLHTKRPRSPSSVDESSQTDVKQAPRFMFGLWMPPAQYTTMAAAAAVASIPANLDPHRQQRKRQKRSRDTMQRIEANFFH